jgi:hypothetical protein
LWIAEGQVRFTAATSALEKRWQGLSRALERGIQDDAAVDVGGRVGTPAVHSDDHSPALGLDMNSRARAVLEGLNGGVNGACCRAWAGLEIQEPMDDSRVLGRLLGRCKMHPIAPSTSLDVDAWRCDPRRAHIEQLEQSPLSRTTACVDFHSNALSDGHTTHEDRPPLAADLANRDAVAARRELADGGLEDERILGHSCSA